MNTPCLVRPGFCKDYLRDTNWSDKINRFQQSLEIYGIYELHLGTACVSIDVQSKEPI